MERVSDQEWSDVVARLDATRPLPDDGVFARWGLVAGIAGLLPLVSAETLPIAVPLAAAALVLGLLGLLASASSGRGRRRSIVALGLGAVPLVTLSMVLAVLVPR